MIVETIHVRGENGVIWAMDTPLLPDHVVKLADGRLTRVNPDGSPYTGPAASTDTAPLYTAADLADVPPELQPFVAAKPKLTPKASR